MTNTRNKIGIAIKLLIFIAISLITISTALAASKPIASYVYLNNDSVAENATVIVYVNTTFGSVNPCYTSPSVLSGSDGSYSTNLGNLKRADNGQDCSGFWATSDPIWAEINGASVSPPQGNATTTGDTIESGSGLQYLSNATLAPGPDITDPVVTLISPADDTDSTTGNVIFIYNVTDESDITSCSLIFNGTINTTDNSITKDIDQNFTLTTMSDGHYNWSVNCTDAASNEASSSFRTLNVSKIGHLEVILITPDSNTDVIQDQFFEFTSQVNCVGGSCGDVRAFLDPIDPSLVFNSDKEVSTTPPTSTFWSNMISFFKTLFSGNLITGMATGYLVPTTPTDPFWTNSSNPANSSDFACLNDMQMGDSCNTTWWVNATGNISTTGEFFSFYNTTDYGGMENESLHINITIIDGTVPSVTTLTAMPSEINQTDTTNITATITDLNGIDTARLKITYPNSSILYYPMTNTSGQPDIWFYEFTPTLSYPPGIYNVQLIANDTSGNINDSETTTFTVYDITPPAWSNNISSPISGSEYSSNHQFNITWTDNIEVDTVLIEHNFSGTLTNYSVSGNSGPEYYYNYGYIATGTYSWRSYANDSSSNWNLTDQFIYEIIQDQSNDQIHLTLNGLEDNKTYTYGNNVNVTSWKDFPEGNLELYRDGSLIDSGTTPNDHNVLPAATYNYTLIYPNTQNYSSGSKTYFATVNPATTSITFTSNPSFTVYNQTQTNVSCYADNSEVNVTLWRDDTIIRSSVGGTINDVNTFAVGTYEYVCNNSATQNYSASSEIQTLTVTAKNLSVCSLSFEQSSPQTYGTLINASCSCTNTGTSAKLYRDGTEVTNEIGEEVLLAAGNYEYICNVSETASWSLASNESTYILNKANSLPEIHLALNGTEGNKSYVYEQITNVNSWKDISEGNLTLYRNGNLISSGQTPNEDILLAAELWNYTLFYSETQNYTSSTLTYFANVSRADTTLSLEINPSNSVFNGTETNVSCYADNSEVNVTLWRNGTYVNSSIGGTVYDIATLSPNIWNYTCNNSQTQNYSAYETSQNLEVSDKNISFCSLSFDPTSPQNFTTTINASCSCTNTEANAQLYRNNVNVTNEIDTEVLLGAGTYNYTCNVSETDGWTSGTNSSNYTINQALSIVNLTINGSDSDYVQNISFNTSINCNLIQPSSGNLVLRENNYVIASGPSPLSNLVEYYSSEGNYLINCSYEGDENYSTGSDSHYINATFIPIFSVTLNSPTSGITYSDSSPRDVDFNCSAYDPDYNLTNISLYITDPSNNNFNFSQSSNLTGMDYSANWTLNLANGDYTWNCLAHNENNDSVWASPNSTFTIDYQAPSGSSSSSSSSSGSSGGGGGGGGSRPECRDNRDNDGDGLIDFPEDPGCRSRNDGDETETIIYVNRTIETIEEINNTITINNTEYIVINVTNETVTLIKNETTIRPNITDEGKSNIAGWAFSAGGKISEYKIKVLISFIVLILLLLGYVLLSYYLKHRYKTIILDSEKILDVHILSASKFKTQKTLVKKDLGSKELIYQVEVIFEPPKKYKLNHDFFISKDQSFEHDHKVKV